MIFQLTFLSTCPNNAERQAVCFVDSNIGHVLWSEWVSRLEKLVGHVAPLGATLVLELDDFLIIQFLPSDPACDEFWWDEVLHMHLDCL